MREHIERQIAFRRERLAELTMKRAQVLSELRAYEDMLSQYGTDLIGPEAVNNSAKVSQYARLNISQAWKAILGRLAEYKHFNASEVMLVANDLLKQGKLAKGHTPGSVRAQLSLYAKSGLIMRIRGGNYRLADHTKDALRGSGPKLPAIRRL